ncbi:MAG: nitroreductase family protein [bacterium]|nr:nitroreductase family protein [bacterium]
MDAIEAIKTRRSVRLFKAEPVATEMLEDIVDCGRLAATARNDQPWEFVVVTDAALRARLADVTEFGKFIARAPACVVVLCREAKYYLEDGAAAAQNILVAARAHGLGSCWVAGDKKPYADRIREMVGAPAGYRLICLIAIGHPAESPQPSKRSLDEVLHWNRF